VVKFDQTSPRDTPQIWIAGGGQGGNMAIPKTDKHKQYARYAAYCLDMVAVTRDQESRTIQREMAAEWMKLADAVRRPSKPRQMQME
jgi:hypothetical protein